MNTEHKRTFWTTPWAWGITILLVCVALFLIVWAVAFGPQYRRAQAQNRAAVPTGAGPGQPSKRPQVKPTQPKPQSQPTITPQITPMPQQAQPSGAPLIIVDPHKVQQMASQNKPFDVYLLIPSGGNQMPQEIVVLPRNSPAPPSANYQPSGLPGTFIYNGTTYVIQPGQPFQLDPSQINLVGGGINAYYLNGTQPSDGLYVPIAPYMNYFAGYMPLQSS